MYIKLSNEEDILRSSRNSLDFPDILTWLLSPT
jgi:hypothetical protein